MARSSGSRCTSGDIMRRKTPEELRSHRWFGVDDIRAFGHPSGLLQTGLSEQDFRGKPGIGIINTWSDLSVCHAHFRTRAEEVKRRVWQAGGFPVELPAHPGTEQYHKPTSMLYRIRVAEPGPRVPYENRNPAGVRYLSLWRVETERRAASHLCDGSGVLGGSDSAPPPLVMGAVGAGVPSTFVPGGRMLSGNWHGKDL